MDINDIKKGLIFVLSWDNKRTLCIANYGREKLLNVTYPMGFKIHEITFYGGDFDFYKDGRWVLGGSASKEVYSKEKLLELFKSEHWIPINGIDRYKRYPHEYIE
jgi:hypothetical protein